MTSQFAISPDGTRIAFDICGSGPAMILLHGGGGSRQDWCDNGYRKRLQQQFTILPLDLRGHGKSDKPTGPASYSAEKLGQDVLAVADTCDIDRFILCGYSLGGNISRYLAANSDRVTKLIMIGNPIGPGVSGEWHQLALDFRARWAPVVHAQPGEFNLHLLSPEDLRDALQLSFPGEWIPSILALSGAMLEWPVVNPIDILCPALWLFGSENKIAMDTYQEYKEAFIKTDFIVHILEGLTHSQEIEAVDQVISEISAFTRQ